MCAFITEDFKEKNDECLLTMFGDRETIVHYMRGLEGVWTSFHEPHGPLLWYCNTSKTQHLSNMIKNQKSPRGSKKYPWRNQPARMIYTSSSNVVTGSSSTMMAGTNGSGQREKFFDDNINFVPKRNAWNRVQLQQRTPGYHPYMPPQRRQVQPKTQRGYYSSMVSGSIKPNHKVIDTWIFLHFFSPAKHRAQLLRLSNDRRRLFPFASQMGIRILF